MNPDLRMLKYSLLPGYIFCNGALLGLNKDIDFHELGALVYVTIKGPCYVIQSLPANHRKYIPPDWYNRDIKGKRVRHFLVGDLDRLIEVARE